MPHTMHSTTTKIAGMTESHSIACTLGGVGKQPVERVVVIYKSSLLATFL